MPLTPNRPRRARRALLALVVVGPAAALAACTPPALPEEPVGTLRTLVFPVQGNASYSDSFTEPRSGGRSHAAQDLMAPKMKPVLAATAGTVTWLRYDNLSVSGNLLTITDADGWSTTYVHLNNDTPGTDDGLATREQVFPPEIVIGATVTAGQVISWVGDSGNAENAGSHLHFELHQPDGAAVNPYASLRAARVVK